MSLSANFEAHSLQNDFVVFFRLGVEDENRQALFPSLEAFTYKIQGKTASTLLTYIVVHKFCQIVSLYLGSTAACVSSMTGLVSDQLK